MNFKDMAEQNETWIIEQRRYFHAHPELSFEEKNTTHAIGKRLEEMEKALEERKRKAAEEKAKKEEASRKAVQQEETSATAENKEDSKAEVPKTTAETQEAENTTEVQEEIWTLDFRVRGTKKQIMDLREYLIRNNIQFGKVE